MILGKFLQAIKGKALPDYPAPAPISTHVTSIVVGQLGDFKPHLAQIPTDATTQKRFLNAQTYTSLLTAAIQNQGGLSELDCVNQKDPDGNPILHPMSDGYGLLVFKRGISTTQGVAILFQTIFDQDNNVKYRIPVAVLKSEMGNSVTGILFKVDCCADAAADNLTLQMAGANPVILPCLEGLEKKVMLPGQQRPDTLIGNIFGSANLYRTISPGAFAHCLLDVRGEKHACGNLGAVLMSAQPT